MFGRNLCCSCATNPHKRWPLAYMYLSAWPHIVVQATCADTNVTEARAQEFVCLPGTQINPAAANSTTVDQDTCCTVSAVMHWVYRVHAN